MGSSSRDAAMAMTMLIPPGCGERFADVRAAATTPLAAMGVRALALSDLVAPYEIRRADSAYHVALFTLSGSGRWEHGSASGAMRPGELWIAPAGTTHRYWASGRWSIAWCHLDPAPRWSVLAAQGVRSTAAAHLAHLAAAIDGLLAAQQRSDAQAAPLATAYAELLATMLAGHLGAAPSALDLDRAALDRAIAHFVERKSEPITLDRLARRCGMSRTQLCRRFKELYDAAPVHHVKRLRLESAKHYLLEGMPIKQVGDLFGFSTVHHFTRSFAEAFGVPPARFRATMGAGRGGRPRGGTEP